MLSLDGLARRQLVPSLIEQAIKSDLPVRLLGDTTNVALLLSLVDAGVPVEVGRPSVRRWASVIASGPVNVVYEVAACLGAPRPASVGGWCLATLPVVAAYRLAAAPPGAARELLLSRHPAGPYFMFLAGIDLEAAVDVLAMVLDPRYFVAAHRPDRVARVLSNYFGLGSKPPYPVSVAERIEIFQAVWNHKCCDLTDPRWFLARVMQSYTDRDRGLRAASRLLVRYLIDGWVNTLVSPQRYTEVIFAPEHYLSNTDEVAVFRRFMNTAFTERALSC